MMKNMAMSVGSQGSLWAVVLLMMAVVACD